ncbi:MAG: protein-tyrosine phosphatase family protein [Geminicoccaceae bacterium]
MKPSTYSIACHAPGTLYIMPKPSSDWLQDDIAAYRSMGMDKVVSLLTTDEAYDVGLQNERAACEAQHIDYTQFPIVDRGLPDNRGAFSELVAEIRRDLVDGRHVGIHCRAGIGRSGMLAGCVLISLGLTADRAVAAVGKARSVNIPDTEEQLQFILGFASKTRKH